MPIDEAVSRSNEIDWRASADHWLGIVIHANGRLKTKDSDLKLAGRYVTYLIASELVTVTEKMKLELDLQHELADDEYELPVPID